LEGAALLALAAVPELAASLELAGTCIPCLLISQAW